MILHASESEFSPEKQETRDLLKGQRTPEIEEKGSSYRPKTKGSVKHYAMKNASTQTPNFYEMGIKNLRGKKIRVKSDRIY